MKKLLWPQYLSDGRHGRPRLDRIAKFLEAMGNPQDSIPPIFHITGTNGKGSTTAFLKYILEAEGYKVHRFTSPHLVELNERIEVSSEIITDDYLNELSKECEVFSKKNNLDVSYFEGLAIMSFLAFSRNSAVATILEVGLGGLYDATNVIKNTLASIITTISLDHTRILGNSVEEIALEKSGIIKENSNLILHRQEKKAFDVLYSEGIKKNNSIFSQDSEWSIEKLENSFLFKGFNRIMELPLPALGGNHQLINAGGAIAAILSQNKIYVSEKSIADGLKNVKWAGRLQNISNNQKVKELMPKNSELFIDGAHNDGGAKEIKIWIDSKNNKRYKILIVGILARKDSKTYLEIIKNSFDFIIAIDMLSEESEAKNPNDIVSELNSLGYKNTIALENFIEALKYIKNNFESDVEILISGSLYLVGEVLEFL